MMKMMTLIVLIILMLFALSFMMKNNVNQMEKKNIFECGFDPTHEKRNPFSLRFFLLTIIFLLFDLEITFIMPLPLDMKNNLQSSNMMIHFFIIFFFLTTTYMEWKQGALSWMWSDI